MRYRPDIDGLRALSILAVVGCHVGVPGFAGGFVGVDAFFAISGFLITKLLQQEQVASGRVNLTAFYARRVRRLIPAMAVVLVATLFGGLFLLSPAGEQQALAASAGSVTAFVSNYYFGLTRLGYFVPSSQFLPLMHTWSLGVEEQFYIIWPVLMIACAIVAARVQRPTNQLLVPILALGTLGSLGLCLLMLEISQSVAFYSFPTRAWELGAGALLALARPPERSRPVLGGLMTTAGVGAVVLAVATHRPENIFTAAPSLIAVAGAGMIISGGDLAERAAPSRLLASRPIVMIGKVSYSWYLWHWPLLAFVRISALGEESLVRDLSVAVISFGLAVLTWHFVEQPVRRREVGLFSNNHRTLVSGSLIAGLCAGLALALWGWAQQDLANNPAAKLAAKAARHPIMLSKPCDNATTVSDLLAKHCIRGGRGAAPLVVVLGDSHARHLVPGIAEIAASQGVQILPAVKSGCVSQSSPDGPWRGVIERRQERCAAFNANIVRDAAALRKSHDLRGVIIAGMWGWDRNWEKALAPSVRQLRAQGLKVAIVLDVPPYAYSVPYCYAHRGAEACGISRDVVERDRAPELAILRRIASENPGVTIWDPLDALCSDTRCEIEMDGQLLYTDAHHLSYAGSQRLAAYLAPMLAWATSEKPR